MKQTLLPLLFLPLLASACSSDNSPKEIRVEQALPESVMIDAPTDTTWTAHGNPIIRHKHTGDPAAMVYGDQLFIYAGVDECPDPQQFYLMNEWTVFSTTDLKTFTEYPCPLHASDFAWSKGEAWASQVIERNGKFYWYVTVENNESDPGKCVAVAVSDSPVGPFHDALGKPLVSNSMTTQPRPDMWWDDIDPTVFIDTDGQAYLYWGNSACYWAKLKENMVELDGEIHRVEFQVNPSNLSTPSDPSNPSTTPPLPFTYTEAPWIHKRGDWYYLSFAQDWPEKLGYAMSHSIEGPWVYCGILNELSGNSNTNHHGIFEFQGEWYVVYHNGALPDGCGFRRSVCLDRIFYNEDGTMRRMVMTSEGVQ